MGKKAHILCEKTRTFPHFPPTFQHSTSVLHTSSGKKVEVSPFHISFTTLPQERGNRNHLKPAELFRVFHIFPTPYYGYYNKFKIETPVRVQFGHPNGTLFRENKKESMQFEHRMR